MGKYTTADAIRALVRPAEVHRDVYIEEEVFRLEAKHLFANAWVYVGHESQAPNPGDYFTTEVGSQPVLMSRHTDGQVYVYYNRCPHKGTKIAIDRTGNTGKFFRCPYHAWSFKTDGCLLAIPLQEGLRGHGPRRERSGQGPAGRRRGQELPGLRLRAAQPGGYRLRGLFWRLACPRSTTWSTALRLDGSR